MAERLDPGDVPAVLAELFAERGPPLQIRTDDGPQGTAIAVRGRLGRPGARAAFIEPGRPWGNGSGNNSDGRPCDGPLDREVFGALADARVPIGTRPRHSDAVRPHSAPGPRPPAPEAAVPPKAEAPRMPSGSAPLRLPTPMARERSMP